jgi:hypothetical protein
MTNALARFAAPCLTAAVFSGMSANAYAVDGVILIDQSRALAGNVTPGDAPGFPVELNQPGSYRLASNLTVSNPNTTAIKINATNVTLDLNGFAIQGVTECGFDSSGTNFACSNTGTGVGVLATNPQDKAGSVTVMNGIVQGMGSVGVSVSRLVGNVIRNVTSTGNGASGFYGFSTLIDGVNASINGGRGIEISYGTVTRSSSSTNGGDGVYAFHALLLGNFVQGNSGYGLNGQDAASVGENMVQANGRGDIGPGLVLLQVGKNTCGTALCQ